MWQHSFKQIHIAIVAILALNPPDLPPQQYYEYIFKKFTKHLELSKTQMCILKLDIADFE